MFHILVDPEQQIKSRMKRKAPPTKTYKTPSKKQKTQGRAAQNALATLMNEIGYHDAAIATAASTTAVSVPVSSVASGDTNLLRDGNKLGAIGVQIKIALENGNANIDNIARIVLVKDKQSNGATAVWTDVFNTVGVASQRVVGSLSRFEILMDKTIPVSAMGSTGGRKTYFKKYVKLPNTILAYADGNAAPPITNALTLMYVGDVAVGADDVLLTGTTRMAFNR